MQNKSLRVAVVDDDDTFQFITSKAIHSIGKTNDVLSFSSSSDALKYIIENASHPDQLPDVLLLDINMPVLDGWMFLDEFASIKTKLSKTIQIFMVSSSIDTNDIERAKENENITDYLLKPISIDKFREFLDKALSLKK